MPGATKNGVRMYQRIRRYISNIYLYGFFSRKDFARINKESAKDYDAGIRIIKELFSEKGFNEKRGVQSVSRHYLTSGDERLQDSYMLAQLDPKDMAEYLHILNIVRIKPGNANQVAQRLQLQPIPECATGTVYNRLHTLHKLGCLQMQRNVYYLENDGLDELTDQQLQKLYDYVRFCSRTTYPRVISSALRRTLACKLAARNMVVEGEMPVLLRHNTNFHVLDEEMVYALRMHMTNRQWVRFDHRLRLPLVLRVDSQMGRWYALCIDEEGHAVIERLSNVKELTVEDRFQSLDEWETLHDRVEKAFSCGMFSGRTAGQVTVCAKLEFDAAPGLRNQFLREIRIGKIVMRDGQEYYEAQVADPVELKPLLRAYGAYLRLLPGEHCLQTQLQQDYLQMLMALEEDAV